jgi:hypothetical protein
LAVRINRLILIERIRQLQLSPKPLLHEQFYPGLFIPAHKGKAPG